MVDPPTKLVNFAVLFDKRSLATDLTVGGVRLGQHAGALRNLPLTDASPNPSHGYSFRDGKFFESREDGTEVELVLLDERTEATLRAGGYLRTRDITWSVSPAGAVERISIHGSTLRGLDISSELQVEARLGPSDRFHFTPRAVEYHYEARGFSITWDPLDAKVSFLILGSTPWTPPQLSATDLAVQLVEGWERLAEYAWREPPVSNLPAHLRYRRVGALVRAFSLPSIEAITNGQFLNKADPTRWSELVGELANATVLGKHRVAFPHLPLLYSNLLSYRRKAEQLLAHNRGWLECNDPTVLGVLYTTEGVNRNLREQLATVERMLGRLLDPTLRSIDQRTLMRDYHYVDANLSAVDAWDAWG